MEDNIVEEPFHIQFVITDEDDSLAQVVIDIVDFTYFIHQGVNGNAAFFNDLLTMMESITNAKENNY